MKPFIKNKIEKTLIDYFLLDDNEKLKELASFSHVNDYNALELCLTVIALRRYNKKITSSILEFMKMKNGILPRDRKLYES